MPFKIDNFNRFPLVIPDATEDEPGVIKLSDIPGGTETLAEVYANGGGTGGVNNTLGDPANGMDEHPINLRVKDNDALVLCLLETDDSLVGGLTKTTDPNGLGPALVGGPDNSATLRAGVASGNGRHAVVEATAGANGVSHNGGNVYLRTGQQSDAGGDRGSIQEEFGSPTKRIVQEYLDSFGAAHIHGADAEGLYVTADGVGPVRGGTGIGMVQDDVDAASSFIILGVNDDAIVLVVNSGLYPTSTVTPEFMLGGPGTDGLQSWSQVWSQLFCGRVGNALTVTANTIAPTFAIHHVGAGLIKNITVPFVGFTGSITLWPDAAFTYDNTGNISVAAGSGTAVVNRPMIATYDGTSWGMSY